MVKNTNGLSRDLIIHPGETLKEILDDRGMEQNELALRTGVSDTHVSNLINCIKGLSVSYAKKLEYALGIDASFWINLQANYEKELEDYRDINAISEKELRVTKKLKDIVKHLKHRGFLSLDVHGPTLVVQLRRLLNVSSLEQIPKLSQTGAYRLAAVHNVDPYILFTWVRMCDLITDAQRIEQELDIEKLKDKIPLMKDLMFLDVAEIQSRLGSYLAECGIKFSIVKHFRGAPVQGVIKRNEDGTLSLLMTTRRKFADVFWFTFFHEIGHIIHGDIEGRLIDYEFTESAMEDKANVFAENTLIDARGYDKFVGEKDFSLHSTKEFCVEQNIPTYILIGRLQREGHLKHYEYQVEKVKYELGEDE